LLADHRAVIRCLAGFQFGDQLSIELNGGADLREDGDETVFRGRGRRALGARQDTALAQQNSNAVSLTAALMGSVVQRGRGKPLQPVVREYYRKLLSEMPTGAEAPQAGGGTD
jgi:hypothetical protein